ncbi:HpcH/HpaI aldolase family protein [Erwinia sp. MYb416]|uniref:HpcH/HpaI aldolase family protein n=1 Tax=Erwinia sp. MYb416 TaxID=3108532 RepID=UPI0030B0EB3C
MIANNVKRLWSEGHTVLNGWLSVASPFTAEIMAAQGYDSVTIDIQHGLVGYETATTMLQAMRASGVTPMVRVPWLSPGDIMKALDAGAYGIICPMINNAEEARQLVSCVRYPPLGARSFGPTRVTFSAGQDYGQHADNEVLCFAMIETADAVKNIEAIVNTPGLDGIYIGPADLTLGLTGRKYRTGFSPEYAARAAQWGFDLVTVSNDVQLLRSAATASVGQFRQLTGAASATMDQPEGGY